MSCRQPAAATTTMTSAVLNLLFNGRDLARAE
jgi:hypothetical protein